MKKKNEFIIYAIQHNHTKRIYIGSTTQSIEQRFIYHLVKLEKGNHESKMLQEDFIKYGNNFSLFELDKGIDKRIEHPFDEKRSEIWLKHICEYSWMEKYDSVNPEFGYNSQDRAACSYIKKLRKLNEGSIKITKGYPTGLNGFFMIDWEELT